MAGKHDIDIHFGGALDHRIEVLHLEPKQNAVAVRSIGRIADWPVMVLGFKAVQLQDQPAIFYQLLILRAAVSPAAPQQALIPPAAGFDIRDTDERLGAHGPKRNKTDQGCSESARAFAAQPVAMVEIHWS